jgi:hypothetical protein
MTKLCFQLEDSLIISTGKGKTIDDRCICNIYYTSVASRWQHCGGDEIWSVFPVYTIFQGHKVTPSIVARVCTFELTICNFLNHHNHTKNTI